MEEVWKPVVNYEGLYEVSNKGNVKSLNFARSGSEKILKARVNSNGRLFTTLSKNKKKKHYTIHSLVAQAFIGERPKGYDVCHIDGDKCNNNLKNLKYDTRSQNNIDIYRYGSKNPNGKLSPDEVIELRKMYATGKYTHKDLAEIFKVNQSNISKIINGKTFSWIDAEGISQSNTALI